MSISAMTTAVPFWAKPPDPVTAADLLQPAMPANPGMAGGGGAVLAHGHRGARVQPRTHNWESGGFVTVPPIPAGATYQLKVHLTFKFSTVHGYAPYAGDMLRWVVNIPGVGDVMGENIAADSMVDHVVDQVVNLPATAGGKVATIKIQMTGGNAGVLMMLGNIDVLDVTTATAPSASGGAFNAATADWEPKTLDWRRDPNVMPELQMENYQSNWEDLFGLGEPARMSSVLGSGNRVNATSWTNLPMAVLPISMKAGHRYMVSASIKMSWPGRTGTVTVAITHNPSTGTIGGADTFMQAQGRAVWHKTVVWTCPADITTGWNMTMRSAPATNILIEAASIDVTEQR